MKGKKFAEVFASLVKTVAIASVSESSDWYNYQTKEPEGLRKIYYPSATIKYQTQVADKGFTSAYTSKIGLGSIRVIYNQRVTSDDKVSLYAYNPSSNGVVTVSVKGNFTP